MPVLAKFCGIVIRMLVDRTFGTHFHAFYGDSEIVIGINPLRVIQGEAPEWVRALALNWVESHQCRDINPGSPATAPFQADAATGIEAGSCF